MGFAIGDEVTDILELLTGTKEPTSVMVEFGETAKNVALGTAIERGGKYLGEGLVKGGKYLSSTKPAQWIKEQYRNAVPTLRAKTLRKRAGDVLAAQMADGSNMVAKNIEEAKALEELIPGLKFSRGQMTNDPSVINFERSLAGESGDIRNTLVERKAENTEAVRNYLESHKGKGSMEDVRAMLQSEKEGIEKSVKFGREVLEAEDLKLRGGRDVSEAGEDIRKELTIEKYKAKSVGKQKYKAIPEFEIDAKPLIRKLDNISKPMSRWENLKENLPNIITKAKKDLIKSKGKTTTRDLDGLRSELKKELRKATSIGTEINERKVSRLSNAINEIDNILDDIGRETKSPQMQKLIKSVEDDVAKRMAIEEALPKQYREARKYYKQNYIDKYKAGTVKDILSLKGGQYKVDKAQIASKFFKKGEIGKSRAKEFISAASGNKNALASIEDAVKQDFLDKVVNKETGEIVRKKLYNWLYDHRQALKEFNLTDKFKNIKSARNMLDDALKIEKEFGKTEASKILGADIGLEIDKALAQGSKAKAMINLLNRLKGNNKAIEGARNALIDKIMDVPTTKIGTLEKTFERYKPAILAAFLKEPKKVRAMNNYIKAMKKLNIGRNAPGDIVGSDTHQKLMSTFLRNSGMPGGWIMNTTRLLMSPIRSMNEKAAVKLFKRATFDPDFVYKLLEAAKSKNRDASIKLFSQTLTRMGMLESAKEMKKFESKEGPEK
jgi:hypothetical protein